MAGKTLPQLRPARKPVQHPTHNPDRSKSRSPAAPVPIPSSDIACLAEARLKMAGGFSALDHVDTIHLLCDWAYALAETLEQTTYGESEIQFSNESLRRVMNILEENIHVIRNLATGLHELYCEANTPKDD